MACCADVLRVLQSCEAPQLGHSGSCGAVPGTCPPCCCRAGRLPEFSAMMDLCNNTHFSQKMVIHGYFLFLLTKCLHLSAVELSLPDGWRQSGCKSSKAFRVQQTPVEIPIMHVHFVTWNNSRKSLRFVFFFNLTHKMVLKLKFNLKKSNPVPDTYFMLHKCDTASQYLCR